MKRRSHGLGHMTIAGIGDLVLWATLILSIIALFVPLSEALRLERQLWTARNRLSELEVLHPLYVEISLLDKPGKWSALIPHPSQKLSENDVSGIPARFTEMAERSELELNSVNPQITHHENGSSLDVELTMTGSFSQLQGFLMELSRLPMLDMILKMEIRREMRRERMTILARLALEQ